MRFSAAQFFALGRSLGHLQLLFDQYVKEGQGVISDHSINQFLAFFRTEGPRCDEIGLRQSFKAADRAANEIDSARTAASVHLHLQCFGALLNSEMEDAIFLRVRPEFQKYYDQKEPVFGVRVATQFEAATFDISEAAKCLALERWTACVYHTMRVLEHGLGALAAKFKIPFEHKTWNDVIEAIEKAIRGIKSAPKKPKGWKKNEQFYSEAAAQFMHFKNAWRNYTAHVQFNYDEVEAEAIFRHVRDFMGHLSTRVKGVKRR